MLRVDGKHSVSIESDDPAAVTEGLVWARKTWGQLVRLPGKGVQALSEERLQQSDQAAASASDDEEHPICTIHNMSMVRVNGRKGPFWSCHEKLADGSWCSYKAPR